MPVKGRMSSPRLRAVSMDPWLSLSVISAPYLDCAPSPLDGSGLPSITNR